MKDVDKVYPLQPKIRVIRLFIISIVTIFITLLMCEIVVRAMPLYPDTFAIAGPWTGWRYQPGKTGMWVNAMCWGQIRNEVKINSHGLHDVEHAYDKPDNIRRVAILGDSVVAAFEVPLDQSFFRHLETLLNANNPAISYEVVALGHQNYGTDLEYIYYDEEGYRYQPDLVLLLMQPHNDFEDNYPALLGSPDSTRFKLADDGKVIPLFTTPTGDTPLPFPDSLLQQSRLYKLLQLRIRSRQITQAVAEESTQEGMRDVAWELTFGLVNALRERVEADGTQFGVVIEQSVVNPAEARAQLHQEMGNRLNTLNIPYLSLQPAFDAADSVENPLRYNCDTHWTPAGHRLAAETIAPFVEQFFSANDIEIPQT